MSSSTRIAIKPPLKGETTCPSAMCFPFGDKAGDVISSDATVDLRELEENALEAVVVDRRWLFIKPLFEV